VVVSRQFVPFLTTGIAGGALALGGAAAFGDLGTHTTVQEVQAAAPVPAIAASTTAPDAAAIFERDAPGVVQVVSPDRAGSGFVLDKAGHVLTTYDLVRGSRSARVSFSARERLRARVVGFDRETDVAVLEVDARAAALQPLPLGESDLTRVGDPVVAIADPTGSSRTAATGIVTSLPHEPDGFGRVIRTDVGTTSAGEPLLDAHGAVVGLSATGAAAVPIDAAAQSAAQIIRGGRAEHADLGASLVPVDASLARSLGLRVATGLLVETVRPGSAAARAGLRGGRAGVVLAGESYRVGGDVIAAVDGRPVGSIATLHALVAAKRPGDRVALDVVRGARHLHLFPELGRQPPPSSG
jgi:S1-C subfamily serine protease